MRSGIFTAARKATAATSIYTFDTEAIMWNGAFPAPAAARAGKFALATVKGHL